jgi:hypothetical protein
LRKLLKILKLRPKKVLKALENRVLRKRGDVTGDWRELYREEFRYKSSSLSINPCDHITENEIGGVWGTYSCIHEFGGEP